MSAQIRTELNSDHAVVTLNRPDRLNAFTTEMAAHLRHAFDEIADRPEIRIVLLRGAGKAFCAGADIRFLDRLQEAGDSETFRRLLVEGREIFLRMLTMPQILVSAVNGIAAGGGCCLALAADLRIASAEARFSQAFIRMGMQPDWGAFWLIPRLVGTCRAFELMVSGRFVAAAEALEIGLVNEVVEVDQLESRSQQWIQELLQKPALSLRNIKRGLNYLDRDRVSKILEYEIDGQVECFLHPDSREAVRAFLEKRQPRFSG